MNEQDGYSALKSLQRLCGYAGLWALATCLLSCACNGNAANGADRRAEPERAENPPRVQSDSLSMEVEGGGEKELGPLSDRSKPGVVCPSQNFELFLQAYVNSAELQVNYTAESAKHKYPYYWKHNTEPGNPAHPKWVDEEDRDVGRVKYRYDPESKKFIWVGKRLKDGQRWISIKTDEKPVSFAQLSDFEIRRVSAEQYDVEYDKGDVDTYELKSGCWHFTQHWELESIVDCKWPDECRKQREYEAGSE